MGAGIPLCPHLDDQTFRYKLVDLQFQSGVALCFYEHVGDIIRISISVSDGR